MSAVRGRVANVLDPALYAGSQILESFGAPGPSQLCRARAGRERPRSGGVGQPRRYRLPIAVGLAGVDVQDDEGVLGSRRKPDGVSRTVQPLVVACASLADPARVVALLVDSDLQLNEERSRTVMARELVASATRDGASGQSRSSQEVGSLFGLARVSRSRRNEAPVASSSRRSGAVEAVVRWGPWRDASDGSSLRQCSCGVGSIRGTWILPGVSAGRVVADADLGGRVMDRPPTQYARLGDLHVAYQTLGEGPVDIVFVAPGQTSVETAWDVPAMARYLRGLAGIGRLVLFDAIGSGLSDPLPALAHSLDSWTTDVRVVMDAVGLERAVLHCYDSAGTMAMVFAATYPERVSSLILVNTFAKLQRTDDFQIGVTSEQWSQYREFAVSNWGNGKLSSFLAGSRVDDAEREVLARQERRVFSPGALGRYLDREWAADVRNVLPTIQSPTLILHRSHNRVVDPAHGRFLAAQIPGARYVEVEGTAHVPFEGDSQALLDEIREFLTGYREDVNVDRVLATILFTDIVGSTGLAADVGDRRWRELLDEHDAAVAAAVRRFDGVLVKSTGDGALATFPSPGRAIAAAKVIDAAVEGIGLQIRAGLHTGECERRGDDVGGIAVHIASRVAALAGAGQVLVSRTVTDLVVGSDMTFTDAGEHELKGVPGSWQLFAVD